MNAGVIEIIVGAVISGAAGFLLGVCVGQDSVKVTIRINAREEDDGEDRDVAEARGAETETEV